MVTHAREVLLVGSVPLQPAAKVFETVGDHLDGLVRRIPDGEQRGWLAPIWQHLAQNDALEVARQVPINPHMGVLLNVYRLRPGKNARDLSFGPYGLAENALASYAQFRALRQAGRLPPGVRFQVTLPGPGTTVYPVQVPPDDLLPRAREALWREVEQVLAGIPADDLTIQLDVAMEAEHEEYLRRRVPMQRHLHPYLRRMPDGEQKGWGGGRVPGQRRYRRSGTGAIRADGHG
jgi:hypothetical protein